MRTYLIKNADKDIDMALIVNADGNDNLFTVMEVKDYSGMSEAYVNFHVGSVLSEVNLGELIAQVPGTTIKTYGEPTDWEVKEANKVLEQVVPSIIWFQKGVAVLRIAWKSSVDLPITLSITKNGTAISFSDATIARLGKAVETPGEGEGDPAVADKTQLIVENEKNLACFDLATELGIADFGGSYQIKVTYNERLTTINYVY